LEKLVDGLLALKMDNIINKQNYVWREYRFVYPLEAVEGLMFGETLIKRKKNVVE